MPMATPSQSTLDDRVAAFNRDGVLVVPGPLPASLVRDLNLAIDRYRADHPREWVELSDSLCQTVDVLPATDAFDPAIENPVVLELLTHIVGHDVALEEFSIMIRQP